MDAIESPAQSGGLLGRLGCILLGSSWKTTVMGAVKGGALIAISCPELLAGRWDKGELIKGILFFITGSAAIVDGRLQKDHDK